MNRLDGCVYTVPDAHRGIINAIDTAGSVENRGASEIVTGGQDGIVKVWDPRCNEAVVHIEPTSKVSFRTTFTTLIQFFCCLSINTESYFSTEFKWITRLLGSCIRRCSQKR